MRGCSVLVMLLTLVTQGCREEEQDRPLVHEKGVYQGPVDQKLDQDQLDALRQRTTKQQM